MIEFILGVLVCFVFYGVFHLYPTKRDVKPKKELKKSVKVTKQG